MSQERRILRLLGRHWIPAPTSEISRADSRMSTSWPARRREIAAPRPPRPAPTIMTYYCQKCFVREQRTELLCRRTYIPSRWRHCFFVLEWSGPCLLRMNDLVSGNDSSIV